jgi:hypothetical protein
MSARPTNLLAEKLMSLYEAARRLPPGRRGRPVSFSCVLRWITDGIPGPGGSRIKLEAVRVGGRWLTSDEALARWAERLTPRLDSEPALGPRSLARRERDSERAARELDRAGI